MFLASCTFFCNAWVRYAWHNRIDSLTPGCILLSGLNPNLLPTKECFCFLWGVQMITACGDVAALLSAWRGENAQILDKWVPMLHDELKRSAARIIEASKNHELQTSAVIRDAYSRMSNQPHLNLQLQGRGHFFAVASRVMRHILVNQAHNSSRASSEKPCRIALQDRDQAYDPQQLLVLNEALTRLAQRVPRQARMIELSYFGGLSKIEIAEAMALAESTVFTELRAARGWLHCDPRP